MAATDSDTSLLQRYFRHGDQHAMDELFKRNAGSAYRLAFAYLENVADAEDVVQAAFLKLLKNGDQEIYNVQAWLMRIVVDACRDKIKSDVRRRQHQQAITATGSTVFEPDNQSAEKISAALNAVRALPKDYRLPVWLHHLEGLPFKDVGHALSLPDDTVRKRASQGIEQVRQFLAAAGFTAVCIPELLSTASKIPCPGALTEAFKRMLAGQSSAGAKLARAKHAAAVATTALLAFVAAMACIAFQGGSHPSVDSTGLREARPVAAPKHVAPPEQNGEESVALPNAQTGAATFACDEPAKLAALTADEGVAASIEALNSADPQRAAAAEAALRGLGEDARKALTIAAKDGAGRMQSRAAVLLGVLNTRPLIRTILSGREGMRGLVEVTHYEYALSGSSVPPTSASINVAQYYSHWDSYSDFMFHFLSEIDDYCARNKYRPDNHAGAWSALIHPLVSMDNLDRLTHFVDFTHVDDASLDGRSVFVLDGQVNENAWSQTWLRGDFIRLLGESQLDQQRADLFHVRVYVDQHYFVSLKTEIHDEAGAINLSGHYSFYFRRTPERPAYGKDPAKESETPIASASDLALLTAAGACGRFGK